MLLWIVSPALVMLVAALTSDASKVVERNDGFEQLEAFVSATLGRPALHDGVAYTAVSGKGAAFRARTPLSRGTELLVVPAAATITLADIERWAPELVGRALPPHGDRALFALHLAAAPHAYRATLPSACVNGATFPRRLLAGGAHALLPSSTRHYLDSLRRRVPLDYAALRASVPTLMHNVSLAAYRRAYCAFESRAFGAPPAERGSSAMIPLGDLFNHDNAERKNVDWYWKSEERVWVYHLLHDVEAGTELCNNYGSTHDNVELLGIYGFSTFRNANARESLTIGDALVIEASQRNGVSRDDLLRVRALWHAKGNSTRALVQDSCRVQLLERAGMRDRAAAETPRTDLERNALSAIVAFNQRQLEVLQFACVTLMTSVFGQSNVAMFAM